MAAVVVDTSVFAALIFGEPKSDEAKRLLNGHRLYAPTLMGYELAQVTVKKIEKYPKEQEKIFAALSFALNLDINWLEINFNSVVKLALECELTAYDASYLYLSRSLNIPLVTFDKVLKAHCT